MNIFGMFKTNQEVIEDLRGQIENLKYDKYQLTEKFIKAIDKQNEAELRFQGVEVDRKAELSRFVTESKIDLNNIVNNYDMEIARLKGNITRLEEEVPLAVENAVIEVKNEYIDLEEQLRDSFREGAKRMQSELDAFKDSYAKSKKSEYKDKIESLEKANKALTESNIKLTSELKASAHMQGVLEGNVESLQDVVESLVGALPEVSAAITTPEVVIQNSGNNSKK
jgi:chromosome segregation ATPase